MPSKKRRHREIENFVVRSWINFAVYGTPNSDGATWWDQYDGDEGHMEIEKLGDSAELRNDEKFDFDLLVDLKDRA